MVLVVAGLATIVWSVVRYWRSGGLERLQRRWVAFTCLSAAAVFAASLAAGSATTLGSALSLLALAIGISGTGTAIAVAVFRYHLYDIDRLVSRTVSYVVITGVLAGVYLAFVTLATRAMSLQSSFGVAAATLATAALFNPLRRRVQHTVDRRFNRARYDAGRVVDAFAVHVRDSVTLDTVHAELVRTVQRTVQPEHVSIWLT
jgi:Kef-type K+ transport system membrane component KefB